MNFGGTTFIAAAQSAFGNKLISTVPITAPDLDPAIVIATGATQIRNAFSPEQVPGVVRAYMEGVKVAFALPIGSTAVGFLVSLLSSWKRLNIDIAKDVGPTA